MADTVSRLREAAEDLLLIQGQAGTTLRDITERAGANVASVSYHFGSKDALLAEVFGALLQEATTIQQRRLDALPDEASLEDVVRVWLTPALPAQGRDPREARLWTIIHRGMTERAPGLLAQADAVRPLVEQHLIERLAARLPHLSREELMVRHAATLAATAALGSQGVEVFLSSDPGTHLADRLVTWIVGGLRAPATP
ncbi:MAG: TetR/AcrR family transcriptional regulator [Kineosporiaceae bacterium]|nr:TetR/AcrR family transcriptional regulator [Kineosporiaceae bacterium]MBK8074132.1 TetR/AcrR family transcriptional regulator [Kineosporiaceae bacterium]